MRDPLAWPRVNRLEVFFFFFAQQIAFSVALVRQSLRTGKKDAQISSPRLQIVKVNNTFAVLFPPSSSPKHAPCALLTFSTLCFNADSLKSTNALVRRNAPAPCAHFLAAKPFFFFFPSFQKSFLCGKLKTCSWVSWRRRASVKTLITASVFDASLSPKQAECTPDERRAARRWLGGRSGSPSVFFFFLLGWEDPALNSTSNLSKTPNQAEASCRGFEITLCSVFLFCCSSVKPRERTCSNCCVQTDRTAVSDPHSHLKKNNKKTHRRQVPILTEIRHVLQADSALKCLCLHCPVTFLCWWQFHFSPQSGTLH